MSTRRGAAARRSLLTLVATAAAISLPAAVSPAAVRHAAPGGSGPAASCPAANPCDIEDAVEDASVADGDQIVLADGDYDLTETLTVIGEITVRGKAPGFAGARIISNADPSIFMITPAARVRDLTLIKNEDKGQGLLIANGTAERVRVIAPESVACDLGSVDPGNAVIRNSVCSGGEPGVLISHDGPGLEFGVLDGTTAHSLGPGPAIRAVGLNNGQVQLSGTNTAVLGGPSADIAAAAVVGGALATVTMSSSSYDSIATLGASASITAVGSGSNITQPALLASPAGRDFRQVAGSPTIDAGVAGPSSGSFDYAGEARIQAGAIDIGADEAPDPEKILTLIGKSVSAKRTLSFRARCLSTPCGISGKAVVKPRSAKKATRKLKPASASAGETTKLKLKLSPGLARKLKRKGGTVKVKATGFADPASFAQKVRKSYRVRKR